MNGRTVLAAVILWAMMGPAGCAVFNQTSDSNWPAVSKESKPWTYWWWMASAVNEQNILGQLQTFQKAGFGGVHIIPIYGAKGYEDRYIEYLSPRWLEVLDYTVRQARNLGMDVDMTLGSGWCFGGPTISAQQANAVLKYSLRTLEAGQAGIKLESGGPLCVIAYGPDQKTVHLTDKVRADGTLDWTVEPGTWRLYELRQKPSGRMVKRASPGGEGHMLNPFYRTAMEGYLAWFDDSFKEYKGLMPRATYHDSYEYVSNWSPDFLSEFKKRRGYALEEHLPAFLGEGDPEIVARLKGDYRRTLSDLMVDNFELWVRWSRDKGCMTRNEAHGSPGNLLDLYALADVGETEFFRFDRNPLVAKFASSAAHVAGHPRTSSETGTWLKEHYHVTLGHLKNFIDGLFVSGVNHVFYHGTCYSPADAPWPGWVFYASTQMNPRNSIWHDVDALNGYLARCQSVLQTGQPDNDLLVYWPICDFWHNPEGMNQDLTVHSTKWLAEQPIGRVADYLWKKGYAFDYVSDLQLQKARLNNLQIMVPGGTYQAILVPSCAHMPIETLKALHSLAQQGAIVLFEKDIPQDVPGFGDLEKNRASLKAITGSLKWEQSTWTANTSKIKKGAFYRGSDIEGMLEGAGILRETMVDQGGLRFIRRKDNQGYWYFITNQDEQFTEDPNTAVFKGLLTLLRPAKSVMIMDPMSGRSGMATIEHNVVTTLYLAHDKKSTIQVEHVQVYLELQPGQSLILRTFNEKQADVSPWPWYAAAEGIELTGAWKVEFIQGGPELPDSFTTDHLGSWTQQGGKAENFAGTARYTLNFDAPGLKAEAWQIDLGKIASSARVKLNGRELGTVFTVPNTIRVPAGVLKDTGNLLEVEVTNLSANRVRDLDRRGVEWKYFKDINIVNIDYKKFDASTWDIVDSGLLGPVRLVPLTVIKPE